MRWVTAFLSQTHSFLSLSSWFPPFPEAFLSVFYNFKWSCKKMCLKRNIVSPIEVGGYFLQIEECTIVNVLFLILTWCHIFLFLCFCPQLSECSSQQIQGLSSLRSNLATLSIHHSTETMMVVLHCKLLRRIFLWVFCPSYWVVHCVLSPVHPGPGGKRAVAVGTRGGGVWLCCYSSHPCVEKPDNAGHESQRHQDNWQIRGEWHPFDSFALLK